MKHGIHEVESFEELRSIRSFVLGNSDFTVEHRCLMPDENDHSGFNLGHFEEGKLLSALRALPVYSANELEENLDYPHTAELPLSYPGVVFGKACSLPEVRGRGKMRELYHAMVAHAQRENFHFISLTTKPTNPLNEFLLSEGFERRENKEGWHRFGYLSHGPTFVFFKRISSEA